MLLLITIIIIFFNKILTKNFNAVDHAVYYEVANSAEIYIFIVDTMDTVFKIVFLAAILKVKY